MDSDNTSKNNSIKVNKSVDQREVYNIDVKKLIRKLDWNLIPYLSLLYLFSFLDRVNIGYARVYRMEKELGLTQAQYSWTLWIARIMFTWGVITMALAAVKNFEGLMAGRFFLGLAEAGLFPGIVYYMSFWYTRKELGIRLALILSTSNIAGSISGLLAYGISFIDGKGGLSGWQWIFIIEGLPSTILGITTWWILPSTPSKAKWLNQSERDYLVKKLLEDHTDSETIKFRKDQLKEAFTDYKVYLYMLSYFGYVCPAYAMAQLLPTIIGGMGFSSVSTLLLSAAPYTVSVVTILSVAYHSDKRMERCFHFVFILIIGAVGFLIMAIAPQNNIKYLGSFFAIIGITSASPMLLSWLSNNMVGSTKSGAASAMVVSFGNLGGVISGQMYRSTEAPLYLPSHISNMALILMSIITSLILRYCLVKENSKLESMSNRDQHPLNERSDGLDIRNFRYTL
ncbi:MFS general substrate transporter [Conidiobolus coronatus NRRL 28638]|uniref:MFS general substrate transporter n=1 Tax=Conidiobolus coronatus (strain ATCC 28846 / CBS 209.66 / NRRL 28638) TaxID=796925 RepID=A0A137PFB8_CONC2|nr:MFS general substrate transporter [Conidiobolus coronatus NRRL 28638]|eukprot:KXN73672.1 MFS general substrate transporter [Conidiobolus coronatus NRRL 28638]